MTFEVRYVNQSGETVTHTYTAEPTELQPLQLAPADTGVRKVLSVKISS